ncbi:FGGY-family carbohydrate kinase [Algihabitans albus]|uniref:FGGY-family carbohydrate kinase n=1 Tax=Algihabitans albus TaxID=2164067 RepID=UPI001F1B83B5|nr:FGGY-family carbohydrate kinase [Algihabitans albus]
MQKSDRLALGIDVGTSGVRAALIDSNGALAGFSAAWMADNGSDLRDPAVWERTLAAALAGLDPLLRSRAGAVSVDGTSGTVLALDADGAPLGNALLYNDRVEGPGIPAAIAEVAPRTSAAHGSSSGLARAMALAANPGTRRIVHQADWVAGLLSGCPWISDESNALKTGYDPLLRCWPIWLDALIAPDLLPKVMPAGAQAGIVTAEAATRYGLPSSAIVVAGMTDGCASFFATGADRPGDGVTALGTTLTLKLLSHEPIFDPDCGIYSHRIGTYWLAGGASNSGGGALANHFTAQEITDLSARIDPDCDSGLDYYPLPQAGERFPLADPELSPRVDPRPDDDALFLKGLLEGIARIEATGYRRLAGLGAPPLARLRSVGGGARNTVWSAIRERMLAAKALPAESEEAAVGVAQLARAALVTAPGTDR